MNNQARQEILKKVQKWRELRFKQLQEKETNSVKKPRQHQIVPHSSQNFNRESGKKNKFFLLL